MSRTSPIFVLNKSLSLYQIEGGFRTSTDSVLLGASCPVKNGESLLDLGCGVGSAGLCALKRVEGATLLGLDIQNDHVEMAKKNALENEMSERADFIHHDIRESADMGSFNHVICNPPYKETGAHISSPSKKKAVAMGHQDAGQSLQDWISFAWAHIKGQGSLSMIHEASKTDEIIHNLYSAKGGRRFGKVEIFPIFSKKGQAANRVIIRAWKHKKSGSILHRGIVMHNSDGSYSKDAEAVLRDKQPLFDQNTI